MDDLLVEFLTETNESMDTLDVELVQLEQNPNDPALLGNIFRLVHTVKGTCGFLGLPRLEAVAHAGENVLGKIRDGELEVTPVAISLILAALDCIKTLLSELEANEAEPEGNDNELIEQLNAFADGGTPSAAPAAAPAEVDAPEIDVASQDSPVEGDGGFPVAAELLAEYDDAQGGSSDAPVAVADTSAPADVSPLIERLGGTEAVSAAVDLMYQKILADDRLLPFFENVDMDRLKAQQVHFVSTAVGGEHSGMDLAGAHAHLVARGLKQEHFDAVLDHLRDSLTELGVSDDLIGEVLAIVETTRVDVFAEAEHIESEENKPQAAAPTASLDAPAQGQADEGQPKESSLASQSIRVGVDVLEDLMTMVSELVLTRNQLMQLHRVDDDNEDFHAPLQRLNQITSELQEGVMKTRMQPIGNAWAKLPRIIRDLSLELDKKIELRMHGKETELDRQVLELIRDPLTHMVRNSADHGLEMPADRVKAGKPEQGVIRLNAFHEGGHIIIEIKDDGGGLSTEKIKQKAIASGVASESDLEGMTDLQIQQFIFKAGFSTAAKVTSVSGRGVGLDVVRTNIEKIGGSVELKSTEGKGTTFTIKIPLTLAIVSALVVECAGERFAIPQISVLELVRAASNSECRIESINDAPVLRLRERLLPLVSLKDTLKLQTPKIGKTEGDQGRDSADQSIDPESPEVPEVPDGPESILSEEQFIVVAQVGTHNFGIIVDRVFDTEEIVVKPVAPILRDIQLFSGNTILGDGSVIMILDPNGISSTSAEVSVGDTAEQDAATSAADESERVALLIFRAGGDTPKAVPLALVARLEEIAIDSIELSSNGQRLVRYRGQLMPLVLMENGTIREKGRQPVLVFSEGDRVMGLVVDDIVDIVETEMNVEMPSDLDGFIGSAIIAEKATDVIDVGHFLTIAFPDWFRSHHIEAFGENQAARRVLLVDDSPFFRNMLTPLLQTAGYAVRSAESAKDALAMCEAGDDFDVIISDIEMPEMTGFEFARAVRDGTRWSEVPIVALSSHAAPQDLNHGREVGFSDYVAKFDRDALLESLMQTISNKRGAA